MIEFQILYLKWLNILILIINAFRFAAVLRSASYRMSLTNDTFPELIPPFIV